MGKGVLCIMGLTGGSFEILAQTAGTFSTPTVRGVAFGGYDRQILHGDRLAELDARYSLRTESGHLIYVRASGRRHAAPSLFISCSAASLTPMIETGAPELRRMNCHAFIGSSRSEPNAQHTRIFAVDYSAS